MGRDDIGSNNSEMGGRKRRKGEEKEVKKNETKRNQIKEAIRTDMRRSGN